MSTNINYTESVTQIITQPAPNVVLLNKQGPPGPPGAKGDDGEQGPAGQDGEDGTGDATYTQSFVNVSSLVVVHNLGKYPAVVFRDTAGTEFEVDIEHDSTSQLTLNWSEPLSGTVTCN